MPLLQNNSLNICAIFIIVWTCTLLLPTHLNAQDSSYKPPRSLGTANITQQAFPMCRDCEQHTASYMLQASNCQPQTDNCTLNTANCQLPTENCLLPTANSKLPQIIIIEPETFNPEPGTLNLELSTSLITGSARSLPFHLHTNRLGTVDPNSTNFLNQIRATGDIYQTDSFKLYYGTDLALRVSENSTAFFPELYAGAEYRAFRLDIGRFDRPIGLNNHDLSIGSMMVSRNAVTIPRIMFSTPEFTTIPWTNNILEFKAMYSHGWFTDDRYVDDAYLHQKYLYLKVNTGKISTIGGIVHNAFWGGTHPEYGQAPRSFDDYLKIVLSKAADPGDNVNPGQIGNKLGNSLAAYEFGIFYEADTYDLSITRLFYLEDSVSKRFRSPWDGVWGVNLEFHDQNRLLNAITYEHINTRRQDAKADQERGRANYYGHAYYRTGWFYENRTIGLPLITQSNETREVDNNIIVGHHIGFSGNLNTVLTYKLLGTYSRNYGTLRPLFKAPRGTIDYAERREDRYSFLFEMNYTLKSIDNLSFSLSTAFDAGEFRESSIGGSLGVRYSFE